MPEVPVVVPTPVMVLFETTQCVIREDAPVRYATEAAALDMLGFVRVAPRTMQFETVPAET